MKEVEGIETVLNELREVDFDKILDYDMILIGSPNNFGGPTRGVRKFIHKLKNSTSKEKSLPFLTHTLEGTSKRQ